MKSNRQDSRVAQKEEYAFHLHTLRPYGIQFFAEILGFISRSQPFLKDALSSKEQCSLIGYG